MSVIYRASPLQPDANGGSIQEFAPNTQLPAGKYYIGESSIYSPVTETTATLDEGTAMTVLAGERLVVPSGTRVLDIGDEFRIAGRAQVAPVDASETLVVTVEQYVTLKGDTKYGYSNWPDFPAGDCVPKDINGGATQPDGYTIMSIGAQPDNNSVFIFVRPAENIPHWYCMIDGVRANRIDEGFVSHNKTLVDKFVAGDGGDISVDVLFR